jgi:hypothetical protein
MFRIIKNTLKPHIPLKLGRWDLKNTNNEALVKVIYTNADHCGDLICGNPYKITEMVKKEKLQSEKHKQQ